MLQIQCTGESMTRRLFGTDGIRGKIVPMNPSERSAILALHEQRVVCPSLLRLVGEALGHLIDTLPGTGELVVIGWDDREGNASLVDGLTLGLRLAGCSVAHIGICATPFLHHSVLSHQARIGCMITASHNPATDSGIKVFDAHGYKSTPAFEDRISELVDALSQEDREVDSIDVHALSQPSQVGVQSSSHTHQDWLTQRLHSFKRRLYSESFASSKIANPLLLDCSKGSASGWFSGWLTQHGLEAQEVSLHAEQINKNCGAGDFSPTAEWSIEEAASSSHELLKRLKHAPEGTVVGAALDGDGDRCLVVETTHTGYKIIDGDAMADAILVAGGFNEPGWVIAASIESDLALLSTTNRFPNAVQTAETAVGDRWLSHALRTHLSSSVTMPTVLGVEDSGHIVLPSPHPSIPHQWSLVGDGAATLVAYLLARAHEGEKSFSRGWKQRISVMDVDRSRWDGVNALSDEIERIARMHIDQSGSVSQWHRHGLEGEPNLMLIEAYVDGKPLSLGIRNSGTQPKISVSLRLSKSMDANVLSNMLPLIAEHLNRFMH